MPYKRLSKKKAEEIYRNGGEIHLAKKGERPSSFHGVSNNYLPLETADWWWWGDPKTDLWVRAECWSRRQNQYLTGNRWAPGFECDYFLKQEPPCLEIYPTVYDVHLDYYRDKEKDWESHSLLRIDFGYGIDGSFTPLSIAGVRHSLKSSTWLSINFTDEEILFIQQELKEYYEEVVEVE